MVFLFLPLKEYIHSWVKSFQNVHQIASPLRSRISLFSHFNFSKNLRLFACPIKLNEFPPCHLSSPFPRALFHSCCSHWQPLCFSWNPQGTSLSCTCCFLLTFCPPGNHMGCFLSVITVWMSCPLRGHVWLSHIKYKCYLCLLNWGLFFFITLITSSVLFSWHISYP